MKFKIVKDFNQIDKDYQDKVKGTQGWEYVDDDGLTKVVEPNTCYFIKAYDDFGKFNVAISDDNKEVRFLFHNINIDNWQDEDDEYDLIFKVKFHQNERPNLSVNGGFVLIKADVGEDNKIITRPIRSGGFSHLYKAPGEYVVKIKLDRFTGDLVLTNRRIIEIIKFPFEKYFANIDKRVPSINLSENSIPTNGFIKFLTRFYNYIKDKPLNIGYNVPLINISNQYTKGEDNIAIPHLKSQKELDLMTKLFKLGFKTQSNISDYTTFSPFFTENQNAVSAIVNDVSSFKVVPCIENVGDSSVKEDNIFFIVNMNNDGTWVNSELDQNHNKHIYRQNLLFSLYVKKDGIWQFIKNYGIKNDSDLKNIRSADGSEPENAKNIPQYLDVNLETLKTDLRNAGISWAPRVSGSEATQGRLEMKFIVNFYPYNYNQLASSNPGLVGANTQHLQEYKDLNIISQDGLLAEYERLQAVEYAS